ncbi:MAG: AAA family ATPase [Jatrophihabitans sp.]
MPFRLSGVRRTPALVRLEWLLAGLAGQAGMPGWDAEVEHALDAGFLNAIAPIDYAELTRRRALDFAPVTVTGLDIGEHAARATLRPRAGGRSVLSCTVEPVPPYRIIRTSLQAMVPDGLTPRLPMDFTGQSLPGSGARLIAFAGLPGSGKSTLADALGVELGMPVFALDWLLGALTPFGGRHADQMLEIGYEQLTTLAVRQLQLGQSAILDAPTEDPVVRRRWQSLATAAGARFTAVVVHCPDQTIHRARLAGRERGIPGWHQGGDWADVSRRRELFAPWPQALSIDSTEPLATGLAAILDQLAPLTGGSGDEKKA